MMIAVLVLGCGRLGFGSQERGDAPTQPLPEPIDSAFTPTADAPLQAVTTTFGECADADVTGVTRDTFVDSANPTYNFGKRREMRVGNGRVPLVSFDLVSIPSTATVFSATFMVSVAEDDALEDGYVAISPVLEDWTEGDRDYSSGACNWTERASGTPWSVIGAGPPQSRSTSVVGMFTPRLAGVRHEVPLDPSVVQAWVGQSGNLGMALYGVDDMGQGAWLVSSNEQDATRRPCLEVVYVLGPTG